jgi:hypothetical protein
VHTYLPLILEKHTGQIIASQCNFLEKKFLKNFKAIFLYGSAEL